MATVKGGSKLAGFLNQMTNRIQRGKFVKSGFLRSATYPDGTPVAMVAAINNWGAPGAGVPPRPFFSQVIADKGSTWGVALVKNLKAANYDSEVALERMGEGIDGQIRQSIKDFDSVPLKPATIARKGFDKQLVDTGVMLGSVDHEVIK